MNTTNKIIVGALSGMAAGIAIGILTAPDSGKETREKLARQAAKMRKTLNKWRGRTEDELEELEALFREQIDGLKDEVREKVLHLIEARKNRRVEEASLS